MIKSASARGPVQYLSRCGLAITRSSPSRFPSPSDLTWHFRLAFPHARVIHPSYNAHISLEIEMKLTSCQSRSLECYSRVNVSHLTKSDDTFQGNLVVFPDWIWLGKIIELMISFVILIWCLSLRQHDYCIIFRNLQKNNCYKQCCTKFFYSSVTFLGTCYKTWVYKKCYVKLVIIWIC